MTNATPHRRRSLLLAALATLALGAAPPPRGAGTPAPAGAPPFEQSIEVVETSVLAVPPEGVHFVRDRDWRVREGSVVHNAERVEPLGTDPWELVIWVDGPLCDQAALARTLLALAHQAEALTGLGTVRIVSASPEPRTVLADTRQPAVLAEALAELSHRALCSAEPDALFWQARGMPRGRPSDPALATPEKAAAMLADLHALVERRSALLAAASAPCEAAGACALFLISHGYPLDADLRLPQGIRPPNGAELSAALSKATDALAQRLAVARWLLVALPFAPPPPFTDEAEADRRLPPDARPGPEPFPNMGDHAPPGAPPPARHLPAIAPPPDANDVFLLPELAPLRRLANLTAGLVLRVPEQLPPALAALADRRRIWYRTTPFAPGEVRQIQVKMRDYGAIAPAWVGRP